MNAARTFGILTAVIAAAQTLPAESIQRALIPANPDWVLHLDVDRFKQTQLGQYLLEELEKPEVENKLAAFEALAKFDPRRNIQGLTLYGEGTSPEEGVLLVLGQFDADRLVTLAKSAEAYESHTNRQYSIHSWIDKHNTRPGRPGKRTYGAIHPSGPVIFGQKEERVARALDVLDKLQPSLQGKTLFNDLGAPNSRFFLEAATRVPRLPDSNPSAAVLKRTQSIRLTMRETNEEMVAELLLQTQDAETAKQILSVGDGLMAMIAMQDRPGTATLMRGLSLNQDGTKIVATLRLPSAEIIRMMKERAGSKKRER